jgi:hypothetical protein
MHQQSKSNFAACKAQASHDSNPPGVQPDDPAVVPDATRKVDGLAFAASVPADPATEPDGILKVDGLASTASVQPDEDDVPDDEDDTIDDDCPDYRILKARAKAQGRPAESMFALSATNDPFYVGTQRQKNAAWFHRLWIELKFRWHQEQIAEEERRLEERTQPLFDTIVSELAAEAPSTGDYDWPEPAEGDEDPDPLFDSTRTYNEQLARHREHQGKLREAVYGSALRQEDLQENLPQRIVQTRTQTSSSGVHNPAKQEVIHG